MKRRLIRVGLTMGDPSGVGPVLLAKAVKKLARLAEIVIIADAFVLKRAFKQERISAGASIIDLSNVPRKSFAFGKLMPQYGRASMEYLETALELIKERKIDCLVTLPISKEAINKAGFKYSGHTEYLAEKTNTKSTVMMLLNDCLKFSLITRHIPLKNVSSRITADALRETVLITEASLRKLFGIAKPKLVACGVNPHASDNGLIGEEENRIIKPALRGLRERDNICVAGPFAADAAISMAFKNIYDCVIAMYHDQALIPLKLFSGQSGVNVTLGLPFVRTSPLHGTAFDIAAKPHLVNPGSFVQAVKLAIQCATNLKRA